MLNRLSIVLILASAVFACTQDPYEAIDDGTGGPPDPLPVLCDPDTVYFEQDILPMLASSCGQVYCHSTSAATKGVILDSYQGIMNSDIIEPGDPSDSEILEVLQETDPAKRMPPPPNSAFTQEQIDLITTWINQGALNNSCSEGCDTADVRYSVQISSFMDTYCTGCHNASNASSGVRLDNYANVQMNAMNGKLLGVLTGQGYPQMPPNGSVSNCDLRTIELWIQDGAPNN